MALQYWDIIAKDLNLKPISERQLRDRLKKSAITLESQQRSFFSSFLNWSNNRVISGDQMMNKGKGIIPKGLHGIDKEATWCKSNAG